MDVNAALAVGIPVLGGVVWLIRLEGRVNTQQVLMQRITNDLDYIRQRIDRALNGRE